MASVRPIYRKKGIGWEIKYTWQNIVYYEYVSPKTPNAKAFAFARQKEIEADIALAKLGLKKFIPKYKPAKIIQLKNFEKWYETIRLEDQENEIVASTLERYLIAIRLLSRSLGPDLFLFTLTDEHIKQFVRNELKLGKTKKGINKTLHHLYNPLKQAYEQGLIKDQIKIDKFKRLPKQLPDILYPNQINQLFENMPQGQSRLSFRIIQYTGIRRTELVDRCTRKDIDIEHETIKIYGKNKRERYCPLNRKLIEFLINNNHFQQLTPHDAIITLSKDQVSWAIQVAKNRCNIKKHGRTHLLRHSLGCYLINTGYSISEVAYILGHDTLEMARHYARIVGNPEFKEKFKSEIF